MPLTDIHSPQAAVDFIQAMKHLHLQPGLLTNSGKSWPEAVISPHPDSTAVMADAIGTSRDTDIRS